MHIPDGFINLPVSAGAAVVSGAAITAALKKSRGSMEQEVAPMAGLTAVFIFAVQMLNFPVAAGTSGHLLGGALAAILVGPWVALLAMTVVLSLQAFIFADGGLSAIGLNIMNMGVLTVLVGWFVFTPTKRIFPTVGKIRKYTTTHLKKDVRPYKWVPILFRTLFQTECSVSAGVHHARCAVGLLHLLPVVTRFQIPNLHMVV